MSDNTQTAATERITTDAFAGGKNYPNFTPWLPTVPLELTQKLIFQ